MKHLLTGQNNLIIGRSQNHISTKIDQFIKGKHACICCSNTLLRHVNYRGVYWRCSNCYQQMPEGYL